jgi:ADP-heptose:LPS heptosyltransferase
MYLIRKHLLALKYVIAVIIPKIIKTGKKPVIFSKWSGIGDIICTIPAALEIAKKNPNVPLIYNCYKEFKCIPQLAGLKCRTTSFNEIGLIGFWYRWLLKGYFQFSSDDDRPGLVPSQVYIKDFGCEFGIEVSDDHPRIESSPQVIRSVRNRLIDMGATESPLIVIHPGPSWPVREWPVVSWIQLVKKLHTLGVKNVIQIGTSVHSLTPGASVSMDINGAISLVDQLTLEETIALISLANVFIGIDSGMLHVAASVGTPSVGLWGPTSPQFRFSEKNRQFHITSSASCQGCHHRIPREHWITGCPYDIKCMKDISEKDVLNNTDFLMNKKDVLLK